MSLRDVLEQRAVERVAAGLGDDADLAAGAGAVLGRIAARLDAELLHVLEARLQLERRVVLAVHVARRRVDDGRAFDAVVLDDVLLDGAAAEADVLPRAGAGVLRAGRLQQQLRHLAAVDRQLLHLALADVGADARRAHVDGGRVCRRPSTVSVTPAGCSSRSRLNSCPTASVMSVYSSGGKLPNGRADRVDRRLQVGHDVAALRRST